MINPDNFPKEKAVIYSIPLTNPENITEIKRLKNIIQFSEELVEEFQDVDPILRSKVLIFIFEIFSKINNTYQREMLIIKKPFEDLSKTRVEKTAQKINQIIIGIEKEMKGNEYLNFSIRKEPDVDPIEVNLPKIIAFIPLDYQKKFDYKENGQELVENQVTQITDDLKTEILDLIPNNQEIEEEKTTEEDGFINSHQEELITPEETNETAISADGQKEKDDELFVETDKEKINELFYADAIFPLGWTKPQQAVKIDLQEQKIQACSVLMGNPHKKAEIFDYLNKELIKAEKTEQPVFIIDNNEIFLFEAIQEAEPAEEFEIEDNILSANTIVSEKIVSLKEIPAVLDKKLEPTNFLVLLETLGTRINNLNKRIEDNILSTNTIVSLEEIPAVLDKKLEPTNSLDLLEKLGTKINNLNKRIDNFLGKRRKSFLQEKTV